MHFLFFFRDSRIIEIDFDIEKFFNFSMIFVSSTRFVSSFVFIKQNKILARYFEIQNRDFFFDSLDLVALIVTIFDKFETMKFQIYKKVMFDVYYKMKWQLIVIDEINFLIENNIWYFVNRSIHNKIFNNKWVFKLKKSFNDEIVRHKTR